MTIYEHPSTPGDRQPGYEWVDLKGNILKVPDASWDPAHNDDKGLKLQTYLKQEKYDGPGDWNPR